MKILFLTSLFPNSTKPINGIFNLSRVHALQDQGCDVRVVAPIGLTPKESDLFPFPKFKKIFNIFKGINQISFQSEFENIIVYHPKWYWLPRRFFWKYELELLHFFAGRKIRNIINEFNPDLIITSWIHPFSTYSKFLEKYFDGKILSISEGSDLLINPKRFRGWKSIEKTINQHRNEIIFVSNNQKKAVEKSLNLKEGRVIHNGFNTNNFWYSQEKLRCTQKIKLITIGNLWNIKGHDLLLNALLLLGKDYCLTIIGEGEKKNEYIEFVNKNLLQDQVTFINNQPNNELKKFIDVADIYIQASRSEGLPAAPLEAMGCGLPVVASNVGGLQEIVIDGFNGFLFESENVDELASKIQLASKIRWDNLAIANYAKTNFSWQKWAKEIIEQYKNETI